MESRLIKKLDDWDCRAISEDFLNKFMPIEDGINRFSYAPFVELVKRHRELALTFRGNDNNHSKENPLSSGKVIIYRNNHAMFTVGRKKVSFNPNYLRYDPEWREHLNKLIEDYNYNAGKSIQLNDAIYSNNLRTKVEKWSCSFEKSSISAKLDRSFFDNIDDIYELLTTIFDRYFDGKYTTDQFVKWAKEHGAKNREKIIIPESKQIKLEKIRQQQLFKQMKAQRDGYYFYDMEFQQKHKSQKDQDDDRKKGLSNKPDMQAIRFDADGNPEAWVFVEVKCTESAYKGNSGLNEYLEKMREYIADEENLSRRRREAFLIMSQYSKLGLETFEKSLNEDMFNKLHAEILLVFTDDAINRWKDDPKTEEFKKNQTEIDLSDGSKAILVKVL